MKKIYTKTNYIRIHAKNYYNANFHYISTPKNQTGGCGAKIFGNGGLLASPNYSDRNYSLCEWYITVPAPNNIRLYFTGN